ncbi:hypothetical protein HDV01_002852 [Terramyces sp. JEL0728]|nr:hypothetical protein HDV01_002852 [Terramyces sp. JEL0728]
MSIQLPVEIWYQILLLADNPRDLSHTNKKLYFLSLNPATDARWLVNRYHKDAFFGALYHWTSNEWRQMIYNECENKKLEPPIPDERKGRSYVKTWWFDKASKCKRCKGYGDLKPRKFDKEWIKLYRQGTTKSESNAILRKKLISDIDGLSCPFETHQMRILILLFQQVRIEPSFLMLIRFAASTGHPKLLSLLFQFTSLNKDSTVEWPDTIKNRLYITLNYHDDMKELFYQSLYTGKIVCCFQIINTNLMKQLLARDWSDMLHACVHSNSISILHLFMEKNSQTRPFHVISAIRHAAVPFFGQKKQKIMALRVLETLPDALLNEGSERFVMFASESGQDDALRYLNSKGQQFNFLEGAPLFNAAMFGQVSTVKLLLYEIRVNSYIFHKERAIVICLLIFDHLLVLYALITGLISLVNGWVCTSLGLGYATFSVFGFVSDSSAWCVDSSTCVLFIQSVHTLCPSAAIGVHGAEEKQD